MARPRTPIGTFGEIEFKAMSNGSVRARTRFRDLDGKMRRIEATDATRKKAEHRLKEKLAARSGFSTGSGDPRLDSTFAQLVDVWPADLDHPDGRSIYVMLPMRPGVPRTMLIHLTGAPASVDRRGGVMHWRTTRIDRAELAAALAHIRTTGGTITRCCPQDGTCIITYCVR